VRSNVYRNVPVPKHDSSGLKLLADYHLLLVTFHFMPAGKTEVLFRDLSILLSLTFGRQQRPDGFGVETDFVGYDKLCAGFPR
jgi:hypothetical protein